MDTAESVPGGAVTAGSFTTVYAEAAADSGDVIEWPPGGEARHWHDGDVTRWSDEEDGGPLAAESDVTIPASAAVGKFVAEIGLMNNNAVSVRTDDVTNRSIEATSHHVRAKSEGSRRVSVESHLTATAVQADCSPAAGKAIYTIHTDEDASDAVSEAVNAAAASTHSVETPVNAVDITNTTAAANTAVHAVGAADTGDGPVDEVDAVHPRLSSGAARRRRSSYPAFVCDTCCRDTSGWQDCVDHAYRSGHGLAARCALCRLPAVRCRRRGRPGVWHRCVVVDTVRKLGARNVAALVAGSHLTAPRPWRLSCGECGASFAAKTARLVSHVVECGHAVRRHCEKCLFPVFVFGLNDERREMHVCVGNAAWLRAEEGALLATAADRDTAYETHLNGGAASPERGGGRGRSRGTSSHHCPSQEAHPGSSRHHSNGNGTRSGEDVKSDCHHRTDAFKTTNGSGPSNNHSHHNGGGGGGGVGMSNNGEVGVMEGFSGSVAGGRVMPLASTGAEHWPEERTPSCVAI